MTSPDAYVVSTGVLIRLEGGFRGDDAVFHLPAAIALAIATWLAVSRDDRQR